MWPYLNRGRCGDAKINSGENMVKENNQARKRLPASERKKVILDAALSAFVEFGYHGALMDTIAERAMVTKPILYRHFPSKVSLLLALLDRAGEDLRNSLTSNFDPHADWITSIKNDVRSYLNFVSEYDMPYRLLYVTDLSFEPTIWEHITRIRQDILGIIIDHIKIFTDLDQVSELDIRITAVLISGMAESTVTHWLNDKDAPLSLYEVHLTEAITRILSKLPPRKQ
jgi:AcrR family transcriptional regulator